MNTFAIVVVTILLTMGVTVFAYCVALFVKHTKRVEAQNESIERLLAFVAKGHQLSTILDIKGAVLSVPVEQFAAQAQALLERVDEELKKNDAYRAPSTWAYVVLKNSGIEAFLDGETRRRIDEALTRLRANNDHEGARTFLHDVVEQLKAPQTIH